MTVRRARVGDVMRLERRTVTIDPFEDYRLIGIYSFGRGIFHREPKLGAEVGDYRFFAVEPGDLVLSNIQAWEGAIAYATSKDAGAIGTHRFLTYVAANDEIDMNWARYFFLSPAGFPLIQQAAPGTVKRNRTLAIERFEALEIPLPDIQEQRRTAARLDRLVSKAELVFDLAKRWARVEAALVPAIAQRHDLTQGAKRGAGWEFLRLGDVMDPANDIHRVESDGIYPNVGVLSFGRGLFKKPPIEGSATSARTLNRIRTGQFMYSRLFAFEGAYAAVSPPFEGCFVSHEFPTFDVDQTRAMAGFIAAYLRSPSTWAELASSSKGLGVRRQRIHVEKLLEFRVWLPPLQEQERTVAALSQLAHCGAMREVSGQVLAALGASTLNRAFAGLL